VRKDLDPPAFLISTEERSPRCLRANLLVSALGVGFSLFVMHRELKARGGSYSCETQSKLWSFLACTNYGGDLQLQCLVQTTILRVEDPSSSPPILDVSTSEFSPNSNSDQRQSRLNKLSNILLAGSYDVLHHQRLQFLFYRMLRSQLGN
jgi:hypothetical protein